MKFCKEDILTVNKCPGIYALHNIINDKYYIGRAKILRKRLQAHMLQVNKENTKYPIYKAILKYGAGNFELLILEEYDANNPDIERILDDAEKFYIKKYNSYGSTGYNQTYGGDAGITGYKFTDEQRARASANIKKIRSDGRYTVYVYNIDDSTIKTYVNFKEFATINNISIHYSNVRSLVIASKYIVARTKDLLTIKINKFNISNQAKHLSKLLPDKDKFIWDNNHYNLKELKEKYNVCHLTIYKWRKIFGIT